VLVLAMLAVHLGRLRGTNVVQPQTPAKSVTVE